MCYVYFYRLMEGFDAIYYEEEIVNNEDSAPGEVSLVPDPVVIRGAGNMTVYVSIFYIYLNCIWEFFNFNIVIYCY